VTNADNTAVTVIELLTDAREFVSSANLKTAEYILPVCDDSVPQPDVTMLES